MSGVSVVIPVKDGERYLEELLEALAREGADEVLVIDSGSRDRSLEIARAAGVELLRIDPAEFGHGRTRNLGAERTSGELICFLTQDATPVPGWLGAYREAFALDERVGAAYGPHLPRADTSPMIARELSEFFAGFAAGGAPVLQRSGDPTFLSNVNACYARACWEEIRFREVPYSEDQAFGSDLLAAGWHEGLPPGRRGAARARLRHDRVHAPLLRRVPRPAREHRPRRAVRAAWRRAPRRRRGGRRPPLDGAARDERRRAGPLDGSLDHTPRRAAHLLRAGLARRAGARAAAATAVAGGEG